MQYSRRRGFTIFMVASFGALLHEKGQCLGFSMTPPCEAKSAPMITASTTTSSEEQFDSGCVANPVILPPTEDCEEWQCYYYGNSGSWNGGRPCFLPTGSSGLATSTDGLQWTKIPGKESEKAILTPSLDGSGEWDSVQTGVGDVVRIDKDNLQMYYFGGDEEEISMGPGSIAGFRMRIGRAKSSDNGRTWTKDKRLVLDYNESEGIFASWPRVVTPADDKHGKPWVMYYHSFDLKKWKVFRAESTDKGDSWTRTGLVIEGGDSEDDFDFSGIGTRDVVHWKDGLLMIYEGVDKAGTHRLGAAFSNDEGKSFSKLNDGKPILEPGKGPLGEWTKQVIGTPFVVNMPDGSLRIYHCGKESSSGKMAIGVIESPNGDIEPECWKPVNINL